MGREERVRIRKEVTRKEKESKERNEVRKKGSQEGRKEEGIEWMALSVGFIMQGRQHVYHRVQGNGDEEDAPLRRARKRVKWNGTMGVPGNERFQKIQRSEEILFTIRTLSLDQVSLFADEEKPGKDSSRFLSKKKEKEEEEEDAEEEEEKRRKEEKEEEEER
ncbi:hypothetical protein HZH68_015041 [Vespula germanica]|uniref:Uncharacterized protein n=1 Tax=Vespula germanica TaxID=30212 RepID=A0A834MRZ6_VESGE|nr:hypothetical protein HZH68_015041 [Vespula germanica]